jgi:TetR/AcrR family transcriptional regulator, regulator of biofilm formation and stress response
VVVVKMASRSTEPGQSRVEERILDATMGIVGKRGLEAVTHRSVAKAAGVSLGAISHHFRSRQALLEATLTLAAAREVERLDRLALELQSSLFAVDDWIAAMSSALASDLERDPIPRLAQYELLLASARYPKVRELARAWREAHLRVASVGMRGAGSSRPEEHGRLLVVAITGLLLKQLADPEPGFESNILRPQLRDLVYSLVGAS